MRYRYKIGYSVETPTIATGTTETDVYVDSVNGLDVSLDNNVLTYYKGATTYRTAPALYNWADCYCVTIQTAQGANKQISITKFFEVAFFNGNDFITGVNYGELMQEQGTPAVIDIPEKATKIKIGYWDNFEPEIMFLNPGFEFVDCKPKLDDDAGFELEQETNEKFFRVKYNGKITLNVEDFDTIYSRPFDTEFLFVVETYKTEWVELYRGKFFFTDLEVNKDDHTVTFSPETVDRYTKVLDNLETEYDLIKLAPRTTPIEIWHRCAIQLYAVGDNKLTNYISGQYFEQNCEAISGTTDETDELLTETYKFGYIRSIFAAEIHHTGADYTNDPSGLYVADENFDFSSGEDDFYMFRADGNKIHCHVTKYSDGEWAFIVQLIETSGQTESYLNVLECSYDGPGQLPRLTAVGGGGIWGTTDVDRCNSEFNSIYGRYVFRSDNTIYDDLPADDMATNNFNNNKAKPVEVTTGEPIKFSNLVSAEPTEYGQNLNGKYFLRYTNIQADENMDLSGWLPMPVAPSVWRYNSIWFCQNSETISQALALDSRSTIRDCYNVVDVLIALLKKVDETIILQDTDEFSQFLSAAPTPVVDSGHGFTLYLTPKSNVISSYYDQPAQSAKITLSIVFNMLKDVFKCYWYIDSNNNFHAEHVKFFENGLTYSGTPDELVDLTAIIATPTLKPKAWGQNLFKYEKNELPAQYLFGWADTQSRPFNGYPIKSVSKYVQPGANKETTIGNFAADIDFILTAPNEIAPDGFALLACPINGQNQRTFATDIQTIIVNDQDGLKQIYQVQNIYCAFVWLHSFLWLYEMGCKTIIANNIKRSAASVIKGKTQDVEFVDVAMSDVLANAELCEKTIKTFLGDGAVKKLTINANSLHTKATLLYETEHTTEPQPIVVYYKLTGTATGSTINCTINGETVTISVVDGAFEYEYETPIETLSFQNATNLLTLDCSGADNFNEIETLAGAFKGCTGLTSVIFTNAIFGNVESTAEMFRNCTALTSVTWNNLTNFENNADASYMFAGCTSLTSNPDGGFSYASLANAESIFNGCTALASVVISSTLENVTTLESAFENCSALVSLVIANSNFAALADATNTFAGCNLLTTINLGTNSSWKPDIDLTDAPLTYSAMQNVVSALFEYSSGVHTCQFNDAEFSALTEQQQQQLFDDASVKYWQTNQPAITYHIRGTVTAGTTSITLRINSVNVNVDCVNGAFDYEYQTPLNSLNAFADANTLITALDFTDADTFANVTSIEAGFRAMPNITSIVFGAQTFENCTSARQAFQNCKATTLVMDSATFGNLLDAYYMFQGFAATAISLPSATFAKATNINSMLRVCTATTINMPAATFERATDATAMVYYSQQATTINMPSATFASVTSANEMFRGCGKLENLDLSNATFFALTTESNMFHECRKLSKFTLTQTEKWQPSPLHLHQTIIDYDSMQGAVRLLKTSATAKQIYFPSATWNTLSTAQQNELISNANAKNWTIYNA